jgi:selenocysteine lyase/cysteine desulfurase
VTPEDLRAEMPAVADDVYLNTGASGPAPRRVVEATTAAVEHHEYAAPVEEGAYPYAFDVFEDARVAFAEFLGAEADEIALTHSTADGIARAAAGLKWSAGDVVVHTDLEHAAGLLPWWFLERRGVERRVLETSEGRLDLGALSDAVADARLLCLNSITWTHGTRLPVREIVEIAHEADCRVLVDAVQSPGQTPVDLSAWDADIAVGASHKWLLGPWGAGWLYLNDDRTGDVEPPTASYRSVEEPSAAKPRLKQSAARFEIGTTSPAPYIGAVEAMAMVNDLGMNQITGRIERLTDRLKTGLGDRLRSPRRYESGLVTFNAPDGEEPEAFVERAREAGVVVRSLPVPEACRASVHAFNDADDIDALLALLDP